MDDGKRTRKVEGGHGLHACGACIRQIRLLYGADQAPDPRCVDQGLALAGNAGEARSSRPMSPVIGMMSSLRAMAYVASLLAVNTRTFRRHRRMCGGEPVGNRWGERAETNKTGSRPLHRDPVTVAGAGFEPATFGL